MSGGTHGFKKSAHLGGKLLRLARQLGCSSEHLAGGCPGLPGRARHAGDVAGHLTRAIRGLGDISHDLLRGRALLLHRRSDDGRAADFSWMRALIEPIAVTARPVEPWIRPI
jgi:hypothetical protein